MKNEQLRTKVHSGRVTDPWEQEPLRRAPRCEPLSPPGQNLISHTQNATAAFCTKVKSRFQQRMDPEGISTELLSQTLAESIAA